MITPPFPSAVRAHLRIFVTVGRQASMCLYTTFSSASPLLFVHIPIHNPSPDPATPHSPFPVHAAIMRFSPVFSLGRSYTPLQRGFWPRVLPRHRFPLFFLSGSHDIHPLPFSFPGIHGDPASISSPLSPAIHHYLHYLHHHRYLHNHHHHVFTIRFVHDEFQ